MKKTATIADLWDGDQLKVTFRRCFDHRLLIQWYEILQIAQTIHFSGEEDALIWKFDAKGTYSVSSFYAVVNFKGTLPVYVHALWKVKTPPKIHFFLWLIAHNKILTRDNLVKRQHVDDLTCVFCSEPESCDHLFFDCCVAQVVWKELRHIMGFADMVFSFTSVASMWLCEKKHVVHNSAIAAALWVVWTTRNDLCFNRTPWSGMQRIWRMLASTLSQWRVLFSGDASGDVDRVVRGLEHLVQAPPPLLWPDPG